MLRILNIWNKPYFIRTMTMFICAVRTQKYTTLCAPKLLLCDVYVKSNETVKFYVWLGIQKYATCHVYQNEPTSCYFCGNVLFQVAHCCHTLLYIMGRVVRTNSSKRADSNSFWIINFEQVYQKLQWSVHLLCSAPTQSAANQNAIECTALQSFWQILLVCAHWL